MTITRSFALVAALGMTALAAPRPVGIGINGSAGPGAFSPNPITIPPGTAVGWTNYDVNYHHIVFDDGSYDSGLIGPRGGFAETGLISATVTYHCTIHPSMTGTITVSAACAYTLLPTSASIPAAGAIGTVNVTASGSCAWTTTPSSNFIVILYEDHVVGKFGYIVTANPSTSPRTGTVTVDGQTFTITQAGAPPCPPITIAPPTLGTMTQGVAFNATMTASGGTAPYGFGVSSGALPAGLSLSSAGLLSGKPTVPGAATFTIHATDANGCGADMPYSVTVLPSVPSLPQTVLILLALALVAAGWGYLGRRRGVSSS